MSPSPSTPARRSRVLLVPRHEGEYARVGHDRPRRPAASASPAAPAARTSRASRAASPAPPTPTPPAASASRSSSTPTTSPSTGAPATLEREYRATVEEILEERGDDGRIANWLRAIKEPGALADTAGYSPDLTFEQKVELLETTDVTERLETSMRFQRERLAELQVRRRIREDVEEGAGKQQREYVLRKQMESIRRELGEDDGSFVDEYRTKIEEAGMPEAVREQAERELGRLERMGEQSGESSMIRTYLDWLISVPWSKRSEDRLDPSTPARCSTPTTPASRTSRTASSSTSRSRSCARSAGSRRTRSPARS